MPATTSRYAQCVAHFRPVMSPAAANSPAPVHTEVIHFAVGSTARNHVSKTSSADDANG